MELSKILRWIEGIAPPGLQENYDNSGLIIGGEDRGIDSVVVCLDADEKALEFAAEKGAGLVVSHHPCVFRSLKSISPDSPEGKTIFTAIRNRIAVYSAHTNFDSAEGGLTDILCSELGLENVRAIKPAGDNSREGMGRVGDFSRDLTFNSFAGILKERLGIRDMREVGTRPENVKRVAVMNGSFDRDLLPFLCDVGPDVLLTGDLKYHDALDLKFKGIYALDAGHYGTEIIFVRAFSQMLREAFPFLTVYPFEGRDVFRAIHMP